MNKKQRKLGIYIHIPFCASKCSYCALYSGCFSDNLYAKYFLKLQSEIKSRSTTFKDCVIDTIYLGGGTPSQVDSKYIKSTLELLRQQFNVDSQAEISIEANPESFSESKLLEYLSAGINRFSLGVQVYDSEMLEFLNRGTTIEDIDNTILLLNKHKVKNFNLDIMYALPNLNSKVLRKTLDKVISANPAHISVYTYSPEPKTALYNLIQKKVVSEISDSELISQNNIVLNELEKSEYYQYEISNFSKKGIECNHNLNFWKAGQYLGFGPSAVSFINGEFIENEANAKNYIKNSKFKTETTVTIIEERFLKNILLGIRLNEGINLMSCYENAKLRENEKIENVEELIQDFEGKFAELIKDKLVFKELETYRITREGLLNFDLLSSKLV
jgi:oxygen-independent coproporphyrinogen-3 oxidase